MLGVARLCENKWVWSNSQSRNWSSYLRSQGHGGAAPNDVVMHSCDNRKCCNPEHLSLGTQAENLADMASKGRGRKGYKLSDDDVLTIMSSLKKGYELADDFGVSPATISMIRNGRTYGRLRR